MQDSIAELTDEELSLADGQLCPNNLHRLLDIMRFDIFTQLFTQHVHTCNHIHSLRKPMF